MRKRLKELLILTFVLILSVPTLIYCDDNNKVDRYSKSSILIDQTTNRVMFEKDPDAKRPLASLSKMMTFLIALEAIENKEVNKNDIITIDKDMAKVKGSRSASMSTMSLLMSIWPTSYSSWSIPSESVR